MRFRRSKLYISALLPLGIGFCVGVLTALMGVGGGFLMVPAMIYLLGMPTGVVVGTSLFQIIFVTANRSEEHTSELQSLMRISYAVFCLKKKKTNKIYKHHYQDNNYEFC